MNTYSKESKYIVLLLKVFFSYWSHPLPLPHTRPLPLLFAIHRFLTSRWEKWTKSRGSIQNNFIIDCIWWSGEIAHGYKEPLNSSLQQSNMLNGRKEVCMCVSQELRGSGIVVTIVVGGQFTEASHSMLSSPNSNAPGASSCKRKRKIREVMWFLCIHMYARVFWSWALFVYQEEGGGLPRSDYGLTVFHFFVVGLGTLYHFFAIPE